ncbi:MAG: ABC transporter ATP-binding protein [Candidatus Gastranaerophilaceae bacterium]|jgi:ATP-binding cassette subfamily B multidrug efflux pump|nr:ABC transporter ATP-binding protein [Christensenellales bacterium]
MPRNDNPREKPRDPKKVMIRLGRYMLRYKWLLLIAIILSFGSNLLQLVGPMLSGYAINAIEPGPGHVDFQQVFHYAGLMLCFFAISSLLGYVLSILMIHISQKIVFNMRKDVFNKLMELPVSFFDKYQTGDILSRISYDIDTVNTSLSNDLVQILTSVITVVGSLAMMISLSPKLVLVFAVTVPMSVIFTRYMTRKVRPLFRNRSAKLGELNGFVEEMVSGQKTIRAYNSEQAIIGRFDNFNDAAVEAYYKADYYGSMTGPSVNFINNLSLSLISVFGALMYLGGQLTLGNVSSFVLYSRKFSGPINEAANILSELQSASAAAERIFRLLDEPVEPADASGAIELKHDGGEVRVENVDFGYERGKLVLQNLSLLAAPGKLIAIVGPTGSGKTTLINLLMRFYDPNSGVIKIDGTDIKELTRSSLRGSFAMVLQDTWLFNGTIYENIAYGCDGATREQVESAAKAARIHRSIMQLPDGYDTILTEDGVNISKGQKQLLTIARAMLQDANMLILDEATSNVDTRTELQIQAAMRKLMENKTCFVIAHRLSTIQNADLILVVRDGRIVEQGRHEDLLEMEGFYSRLYHAQFE